MERKNKSDKNYEIWLENIKKELNEKEQLLKNIPDIEKWKISPSADTDTPILKNETWGKIEGSGFTRYEISNWGRVKYLGRIVPQKNRIKNGKECIGYLVLDKETFQKKYQKAPCGFTTTTHVYSLVAYAFLGKKEKDGYQVHHISNNGYDNSVNNLVLLTSAEHSFVHGFQIYDLKKNN